MSSRSRKFYFWAKKSPKHTTLPLLKSKGWSIYQKWIFPSEEHKLTLTDEAKITQFNTILPIHNDRVHREIKVSSHCTEVKIWAELALRIKLNSMCWKHAQTKIQKLIEIEPLSILTFMLEEFHMNVLSHILKLFTIQKDNPISNVNNNMQTAQEIMSCARKLESQFFNDFSFAWDVETWWKTTLAFYQTFMEQTSQYISTLTSSWYYFFIHWAIETVAKHYLNSSVYLYYEFNYTTTTSSSSSSLKKDWKPLDKVPLLILETDTNIIQIYMSLVPSSAFLFGQKDRKKIGKEFVPKSYLYNKLIPKDVYVKRKDYLFRDITFKEALDIMCFQLSSVQMKLPLEHQQQKKVVQTVIYHVGKYCFLNNNKV